MSKDLECALKRPLLLRVGGMGANRGPQVAVSGMGLWVPAARGGSELAGERVITVIKETHRAEKWWGLGGGMSLQGLRNQGNGKEGA